MAMEVRRVIAEAHEQPILCVAYNAQRREIFTGSQDTTIKAWLSETGELLRTQREHAGWVTGLSYAYLKEARTSVLFSCSVDGRILVWQKGELLQKEKVGDKATYGVQSGPLYCLEWDARRQNLVAGANGHIWVYTVVADSINLAGQPIIKFHSLLKDAHSALQGEEPVRGIICTDSGKLFSVGYDRSLCIWDTDHLAHTRAGPGKGPAKGKGKKKEGAAAAAEPFVGGTRDSLWKIGGHDKCHDGAISAVTFDPDNNWIITGSFDRRVRIWANDGTRVTEITSFSDTLTGLCYVPATKTLWMSANSPHPIVYDPRSATDITAFLQQTANTAAENREERVQRLFRIDETGELLASTNTKALRIYRYNPFGAASILRSHRDWVEVCAYCFTPEVSGDDDSLDKSEEQMVLLSGGADSQVQKWEPSSRMNTFLYTVTETYLGHKGAVLCALYCEELDAFVTGGDDGTVRLWPQHEMGGDIRPPEEGEGSSEGGSERDGETDGGDGGAEAARPTSAAAARQALKAERAAAKAEAAPARPGMTLQQQQREQQARQQVLHEHGDRVSGLVCHGGTLASVSWDLSLMLWDLLPGKQQEWDLEGGARKKTTAITTSHVINMAHDDYILNVAYSAELQQYATASADQGVKLWDATTDVEPHTTESGSSVPEGKLGKRCCGVLLGHTADVTHVKWNTPARIWVTGSADHSVRLWSADGQCVGEIRPPGDAITALEIDQLRGLLIVASMDRAIRVYEPEDSGALVQQHHGHSDAVRCILHVPEKQQYITASWDHTIRVWRAYTGPEKKPPSAAARAAAAAAAEGAALDGGVPGEGVASTAVEEPVELTYAERFPLREPKMLGKAQGQGQFLKKASTEETREKKKKKQAEDEMAAKAVNGLSLKLAELEARLKNDIERQDKQQPVDKRGGRGARGHGARATGVGHAALTGAHGARAKPP